MPRAGAGGGGHQSGGHQVGSHTSGGHRVGSGGGGSRPGGGFGSGPSHGGGGPRPGGGFGGGPRPGGFGGGFGGPTPPPPPRRGRRGGYYGGGCLSTFIGLFAIVIIIIAVGFSCTASVVGNSGKSSNAVSTKSTVTREKLDSTASFDSNCIVDELDWFDNVASAGKSLKTFYDKTGVQPYVVLLAYDSSLNSDAAKNNYANKYFNENIANEDAFLMIYFAEEDQDEDVGYMSYVCGNNALAVMDSEAVEIFWNNIDEYWYSDLSTDDMFEKVFTNTANTIMGKSSASSKKSGIVWKILLVVVVIIVALAIAKYFKKKEGTTTSEKKKEDMPNMLN